MRRIRDAIVTTVQFCSEAFHLQVITHYSTRRLLPRHILTLLYLRLYRRSGTQGTLSLNNDTFASLVALT